MLSPRPLGATWCRPRISGHRRQAACGCQHGAPGGARDGWRRALVWGCARRSRPRRGSLVRRMRLSPGRPPARPSRKRRFCQVPAARRLGSLGNGRWKCNTRGSHGPSRRTLSLYDPTRQRGRNGVPRVRRLPPAPCRGGGPWAGEAKNGEAVCSSSRRPAVEAAGSVPCLGSRSWCWRRSRWCRASGRLRACSPSAGAAAMSAAPALPAAWRPAPRRAARRAERARGARIPLPRARVATPDTR